MKITLNIEKRYAYVIIGVLVLTLGFLGIYALAPGINTSQPYHISDQISVSVGGVEKTLQEAIDNGDFGSLWSQSGSDVYYNSGNVGIGTANPTAKLQVVGSIKISSDTTICDSSHAGIIRWTGTDFEGCDGNSWLSLTGGSGSGTLDLVYGLHSSSQCTALGGSVQTDGSDKFCRFSGNCPSGWLQFKQWSATTSGHANSQYCGNTDNCRIFTGSICCTTSYHSWSNTPRETCTCNNQPLGCSITYASEGPDYCDPTSYGTITGYATITQIGCY